MFANIPWKENCSDSKYEKMKMETKTGQITSSKEEMINSHFSSNGWPRNSGYSKAVNSIRHTDINNIHSVLNAVCEERFPSSEFKRNADVQFRVLFTYNIHSTEWKLSHPFTLQQAATSVSLSHKIFMQNSSIVICDTISAYILKRTQCHWSRWNATWMALDKGLYFVRFNSKPWISDDKWMENESLDIWTRLGMGWALELWLVILCINNNNNTCLPMYTTLVPKPGIAAYSLKSR